jgi:hypothetical protein
MCPATATASDPAADAASPLSVAVAVAGPGPLVPAARPHGFRPTLRHQAIVVAYFALEFALVTPLVRGPSPWACFNAAVAAILVSPWLLASLTLLFDRPGPLKHWLAPMLLSCMGPALALSYDLAVLAELSDGGTPPRMGPLFLVNVFFLTSFAYYVRHVGPTRCPSCSRRTFIPVYHLWGTSPRTRMTRWCAACGAAYWRVSRRSAWAPERRRI